MNEINDRYDVIVVGGGPAGSTAATLTAEAGNSTLLLEKDHFPRWHIGESLMPATYWTLKRLGVNERMHEAGFVAKHSVQFYSSRGRASAPFYFHEFDDHESSQTWQVVRSKFDKLLMDNAAEKGAHVKQGANVREVIWDGDRAAGVVVDFEDGTRRRIESRVLIDASGQTALIAKQLGLRETDPVLRHAAYFTHYKGAQRDEGIDEGATLVMQTKSEKTWFWYIPQPNDTISVGVVGPTGYLKSLGDNPDAIFEASVSECPALQERIAGSEKENDARVLRDFSYVSKKIAGDGWVMAGDAFGFLDPIYSTGVFLALKSGEFAGDAAIDALAHDDPSAKRLGQHGNTYLSGMEAMRKLVYAYYDNDFTIPAFLKEHPHCREHIVNLLVGNVYRVSTGDLFDLMSRFTHLPPTRSFPAPGEASTTLEQAS